MSRLQELLDTLLNNVPGSSMAAIIGMDGLAVAHAKRGVALDPERIAAEFTAAVRSIVRASSRSDTGEPASLAISTNQSRGLARMLDDRFYLLLLTGPEVNEARGRAELDRAVPIADMLLRGSGSMSPLTRRRRIPPAAIVVALMIIVGTALGLLAVALGIPEIHRGGGNSSLAATLAPAAHQVATVSPVTVAPVSVPLSAEARASQSVPSSAAGPQAAYFPETGHTLSGEFKTYWEQQGGLELFGYPITEPFQEQNFSPPAGDGQTYLVQYFERARFEYHPEYKGTPYEVLLGLLGSEQSIALRPTAPFQPVGPVPNTAASVYIAATGHTLEGPFLTYWQQHGGREILGYPISQELIENGVTVQYFERARLEYHPEFANTAYSVLLGRLGQNSLTAHEQKRP